MTRTFAPSYTLAETASVARALPRASQNPVKRFMATLTAGVTALSMLVATAIPAHADRASDNLAKAVVGALIIGAIVNSANRGHAAPAPAPTPERPVEVRSPRVPQVCAVEISGARRTVVLYPERCLRREGFDYRLPRGCATEIRMRGRTDRAYSAQCLSDAGFRVGGSRRDGDRRWDDHGRRDRDWNGRNGHRYNH
jgi:hypothetical protein